MSNDTVIYTPNYRLKDGFFKTWVVMAKNIYRSRELIIQLFKRDFFNSYKKSFIGISWILIAPIIGIVSWVFLNATGIIQPGNVGVPYPAYILISSSIWGLFMGFFGSASGTLGAGGSFIMQVKYPHEALLLKQTAQHLANFSITFVLNILVLLLFHVVPDWKIIFFPILIIPLFFLGAGMGLVISVVSVVASDITNFFNTALGFVFYITPIVYSVNTSNETLREIIKYNPLTYLVGGVRDVILYGKMDHFDLYIVFSIIAFIIFMLSWRLFYVSEDKVIEKML